MKHTLILGNSFEKIKEIDDDSVHLTVTSPPYYNAKKYHSEEENLGNSDGYYDYLEGVRELLHEIYDITVPGGIVVWNTSPVICDGKRYMIPFDTHELFISEGFQCRDDIIWRKPDGAAKLRCGGWCQNDGKPLTWHPNIVDEKIMVYVKPGKREAGEYKPIKNYYPIIPKDLLTNNWYFNPETHTKWHDAPFPPELVKRCILLYSFIGDTIFDPFLGSGTTTMVAKELERNSIGIELSKEYFDKAKEKIGVFQTGLVQTDKFEVIE